MRAWGETRRSNRNANAKKETHPLLSIHDINKIYIYFIEFQRESRDSKVIKINSLSYNNICMRCASTQFHTAATHWRNAYVFMEYRAANAVHAPFVHIDWKINTHTKNSRTRCQTVVNRNGLTIRRTTLTRKRAGGRTFFLFPLLLLCYHRVEEWTNDRWNENRKKKKKPFRRSREMQSISIWMLNASGERSSVLNWKVGIFLFPPSRCFSTPMGDKFQHCLINTLHCSIPFLSLSMCRLSKCV